MTKAKGKVKFDIQQLEGKGHIIKVKVKVIFEK